LTVPISVLLFQPTPTPKSVLKGLRSFEDWLLGGWSTGSNLCPCLDRTSTVGFVGDQYRPKRGLRAISHISSCLSLRTRSLKVEIEGIGSLPGWSAGSLMMQIENGDKNGWKMFWFDKPTKV
jgi:hypothetical protein